MTGIRPALLTLILTTAAPAIGAAPARADDDDRPWIGAQVAVDDDSGKVLIAALQDGGPAEKAGLMPLDLLVKLDDTPIEDPAGLARALLDHKPGDKIKLAVRRDGQDKVIPLTLGKRPASSGGSAA